jgi:chemotaxis family two-component system response regulator Rcp1
LVFSNVYTIAMNIREPALDWHFVDESSIGIRGGSGSNPNPEKARPSASRYPSDEETARRIHILVVEDNSADALLIGRAIKAASLDAELHLVRDGEQAILFFDEADADSAVPCPALVILDINLPRKQGGDVLRHMRKSPKCSKALVIAVSTSDSAQDRETMTELGANGYFRKPSEYADFMKLGDMIKNVLSESRPV